MGRLLRIQVTKALVLLTEEELLQALPRPLLIRALRRGKALRRREAMERRCGPTPERQDNRVLGNPAALAAPPALGEGTGDNGQGGDTTGSGVVSGVSVVLPPPSPAGDERGDAWEPPKGPAQHGRRPQATTR